MSIELKWEYFTTLRIQSHSHNKSSQHLAACGTKLSSSESAPGKLGQLSSATDAAGLLDLLDLLWISRNLGFLPYLLLLLMLLMFLISYSWSSSSLKHLRPSGIAKRLKSGPTSPCRLRKILKIYEEFLLYADANILLKCVYRNMMKYEYSYSKLYSYSKGNHCSESSTSESLTLVFQTSLAKTLAADGLSENAVLFTAFRNSVSEQDRDVSVRLGWPCATKTNSPDQSLLKNERESFKSNDDPKSLKWSKRI